jgi:hypothetical protein
MAPWREYGRRHVHGICLETEKGHADIEGGYADHHFRVTVQVGEQPAQHRRWRQWNKPKRGQKSNCVNLSCPCRRAMR